MTLPPDALAASTTPSRPSPLARLDRIPIATASHRRWMWVLGFLFAFDLIDLNTFAYAAPAVREQWDLSIDQIGHINSIGFAGMFLGAIIGGRVSDRIGRRTVLLGSVVFYSVFSLATAAAQDATQMMVLRFLTGLGLQAMTGVLLVYLSEMFPKALRGRYQALTLGIGFVGVPVVALTARVVVPLGGDHWRWVFVIGGLGILGLGFARRMLPESIRWQVVNGHPETAARTLDHLEQEARSAGATLAEPVEPVLAAPAPAIELFRPRNLRRLISTMLVCVCLILCFYGFNSWVPTLLVDNGYSTSQTLTYTAILSLAAAPGAFLAVPLIDRFDRRWLLAGIEVLAAVLLLIFGFVSDPAALVVSGFLATMMLQCGVAVIYTYLPETFPTPLRGLGSGIANGTGRLSGVIGLTVVGWVYQGLGFTAVFTYLAATALLMGLVLVVLGERTTNVSLDDVGAGGTADPAR
ncbi:putative metabolite transport protein YyaJ [Marmoricola endophyticus]|uniref:Metabolite transport protein YyaJ n=1 Tax=Marmoricola endophyticus TaxID=2040280 RepID=A0A917BPQ7_9ACTN|nr:MFS transporter [Marmoricola endophyticus]GGF53092.1 putative metabolite transport protein YyaJ [Marmoricola endophyticus]